MPTKHHHLMRDLVDPRLDDHFGETIRITPMVRPPNGRPSPNPAFGPFEFIGTLTMPTEEFGIQLGVRRIVSEANDLRSLQTGQPPIVSVDSRHLAGYKPKQGDLIECLDRQHLGTFEISSVRPENNTRTEFVLVASGVAI